MSNAAPDTAVVRVNWFRELGRLSTSTYRASRGFAPLLKLLASEDDLTRDDLALAVDRAFDGLYQHPLMAQSQQFTRFLRKRRLIPDEQSTEELIRFVLEQTVARSPVAVPQALVDEFWQFFNELFSSPELKGLGELTLDMVRLVVKTYEPLLVEIINLLKAGRRFNQWQLNEILRRAAMVRSDALIVRRQIKAIRHIKPFFQADPRDFKHQAQIVAQMVGEFGPFFIKLAQVAAANADFLPDEIARELAVFHEDVPPMSEEEVNAAFIECYGQLPHKLFLEFDASRPVKSGSIGSVYFAKKPFMEDGREVLRPVVIKVGRHNLDREFAIGKLVLGLAIMSSQYWAPHSKLTPFLRAMQAQVDEFVAGFMEELDFEAEARNHLRFLERSRHSGVWHVPALYGQSRRILEMEYLADASSLGRALSELPPGQRRQFQSRIAEKLLYTLLYHGLVHREIHGDLHPGNLMVDPDGELHLIDWGNVVALDGKWQAVWDYLAGAILGNTTLLTDALIRVSTEPEANAARREEIRRLLDETLARKGIVPLDRANILRELRRGGWQGLHQRGQTVLHLMSNTQQAGLVLKRDYLHLSRALFAVVGSLASLYESTPRQYLLRDLARTCVRLPLTLAREQLRVRSRQWSGRLATGLPAVLRRRSRSAAIAAP
ncbi:MAG: AarF/UbiB family protein [Gammaproteobacteria bacterium]